MPFQLSSTTWWLLLGIFVGFVLFWLIDKLFRRDGEFAAERERREIKSLQQQLTEDQTESSDARKRLADRISDTRRLTTLSEDLRDTVREQDQKIINLETALAAAREQQVKDEPVRSELATLLSEHEKLNRRLEAESKKSARLQEKTQVNLRALTDRDKRIRTLENELRTARDEIKADADRHRSLPTISSQVTSITATAGAAAAGPSHGASDTERKPVIDTAPLSGDAEPVVYPVEPNVSTNQSRTKKANEHLDAIAAAGCLEQAWQADSSLASRHGGTAVPPGSVKSGLLSRLRGAFSGHRPDDMA